MAELTRDRFLGGRLTLAQPRRGHRSGNDAVLLAAAVPASCGERVLDLGAGVGAAGLCLWARVSGLDVTLYERDEAAHRLSLQNIAANGADGAVTALLGDVAAPPAALKARSFDHVIANPPFFAADQGERAADPAREAARREDATPLAAWTALARARVAPMGTVTFIHRVERLAELLAGFGPEARGVAILPLQPRSDAVAKRVILQWRKGARRPLRLARARILHDHEGAYLPDIEAILRDAAPLTLGM